MRSEYSSEVMDRYYCLRRRYVNARNINRKLRITNLILMMVCAICICVSIGIVTKYSKLDDNSEKTLADYEALETKYDELNQKYNELVTEHAAYVDTNNAYEETIRNMNDIIIDLQKQAESLTESNESYYEEILKYEQREELFDKYEYAIVRDDNTRTDITYDQLINLEDEAEKRGIDTDLVLSICMTESNGIEDARSSTSTATGYGQFVFNTGKFVYEDLLRYGTYTSNYALDGTTNLTMMTAYLEYLSDIWDEDIYMIMKNYRGEGGEVLDNYMDKVDSYLQNKDKDLYDICFNSN